MALCARSAAVTPQVVERFLEGLEIHANRLAENPRIGFSTKSNWGVMEYTGLYMVAWLLNRPEDVERARLFLRKALHTQFMDCLLYTSIDVVLHSNLSFFERSNNIISMEVKK